MFILAEQWIPTSRQLIVGGGIALGIILLGLIVYAILRKYVLRARLTTAMLVTIFALAIFFGVTSVKSDHADDISIWLKRGVVAALLFAGLRVLDRLAVVPLLTRGGKAPVQRFIHQIISILIWLFTILGFGSWAFDWEIDKFLAGSAVVSIILGLALQETLGNFFSGLVMQASSPFSIGDWIVCAGVEGRVVDMTWRAVTIHTADDNHVLIPNGTISKEQIVNFHAPTSATARSITVGLEYDLPPRDAVAVLKAAALETPGVATSPAPFIYLCDFADSAVMYRVKFWINEPAEHLKIEHDVRANAWYRLKQKGYGIPYPVRTVEHINIEKKAQRQSKIAADGRYQAICNLSLLAPLSDEEKRALAAGASDLYLAPGQILFRQDDAGESFYIIRQGEVDVIARKEGGPETKVATLKAGDFFGEMSALTGQPRTATIRAAADLACVEIGKEDLAGVFKTDPAIMEKISRVVAERNAHRISQLEDAASKQTREEIVVDQQKSIFGRMLRFFGGSSTESKTTEPKAGR